MAFAKGWRNLFGGDEAPVAPPVLRTRSDEIAVLRESLRQTIRRVNASAGQLPAEAIVRVRSIEDVLSKLIEHEEQTPDDRLGALQMVSLEATVNDYLPTSIETFLSLPPEFVAEHVSARGQTPAQELSEQLVFLEHGVRELAHAVYSGDAELLSTQGRFLQTKFSRSDLDLP